MLLECTTVGRSANPSAAARRGVPSYPVCAFGRAPGIELADRGRHVLLQLQILVDSSGRVTLPAACPSTLVSQAIGLSLLERFLLDEKPLPFVTTTGTTEAHNDR